MTFWFKGFKESKEYLSYSYRFQKKLVIMGKPNQIKIESEKSLNQQKVTDHYFESI